MVRTWRILHGEQSKRRVLTQARKPNAAEVFVILTGQKRMTHPDALSPSRLIAMIHTFFKQRATNVQRD
ncbi:hypothetical protein [Dyella sp.]|uniref:hypothetical protein n=2 Tax=Dyella sp. TaxID=1869338 RepID=UPI002D7848FE|nr:hypothetical protein [Dyella sp.]HET7331422.1 hypothetical protein [Dyella sp.]